MVANAGEFPRRLVAPSRWIRLGSAMVAASALALQLIQPSPRSADAVAEEIPGPASIYFETAEAVIGDEAFASIEAIARVARTSPRPVAVTPFAGRPGSPDQSSGLAHKRAKRVRDALVLAGVPRVRIIIVSPTFVAHDSPRVEVSLVPGVRVLPAPASALE